MYGNLITASRETLNRLIDEKRVIEEANRGGKLSKVHAHCTLLWSNIFFGCCPYFSVWSIILFEFFY
jgi:hypothetical protein